MHNIAIDYIKFHKVTCHAKSSSINQIETHILHIPIFPLAHLHKTSYYSLIFYNIV